MTEIKTCGAWNRKRQRHNRIQYAKLKDMETDLGIQIPDELEGSVEVTALNNQGRATAIRYHLRMR